jgi:hypothetical protein
MLSARISSWRVWSAYASVPKAHAQCSHQLLTGMLSVYKININWKSDAHAEHVRKKLMRMVRVEISSWCACSVHALVPDPYA